VTIDKWREVLTCYQAAIEVPSEQRRKFLESTGSDPEVLEKALRMLESLEQPATASSFTLAKFQDVDWVGCQIGRYHVTGQLGAGGTGKVFAAQDPELVALKSIVLDEASPVASLERVSREARPLPR